MNSRTFFKLCSELVKVRWVVRFGPQGFIILLPVLTLNDVPLSLMPIQAVAADIYGARYYSNHRPDLAASLLGLNPEIAGIIFAASFSNFVPDPRVKEVRDELIYWLNQKNVLVSAIENNH